jgi:hypothetical protein
MDFLHRAVLVPYGKFVFVLVVCHRSDKNVELSSFKNSDINLLSLVAVHLRNQSAEVAFGTGVRMFSVCPEIEEGT